MKSGNKIIMAAGISILAAFLPARAQETIPLRTIRNEINLMAGMVPGTAMEFKRYYYNDVKDLYSYYEPFFDGCEFGPVITLDYSRYLTGRFKLGGSLGFGQVWSEKRKFNSSESLGKKTISDCSAMGQMKYVFLNTSIFKMYAGVAAGAALRYVDDTGSTSSTLRPAFEAIPLGFMWTDHSVYGIVESAFGTRMMGGRIGLGVRF